MSLRRGQVAFAVLCILISLSPLTADERDYDIRDDASQSETIDGYRQKAGKERNERIKEKKDKIHGAAERVKGEVPGLGISMSAHTGGPEIVGIERGNRKLTAKSKEPREHVARGFLQRNADLYGLTPGEVARLRKTADYINPAGNLAWVEFEQELNGLPVFRGRIRFAVTTEGELVQSTGNLVPALEDAGEHATAVSAADAVRVAAESIGVPLPEGSPVLKEASGAAYLFDAGPFTHDINVRLEYFPLDSGIVTLAWSMILRQQDAAFYTYVSAEGGELLWRKNIVYDQSQPATYVVYGSDSPAPLSPSTATPGSGIQGALAPRTSFTVISEGAFDNLGWMTDGTSITTGNNVDAGLDLVSPDGVDDGTRATGTAFRVFDYAFNPAPGNPPPGDEPSLASLRLGNVVHMFFWANRYHDALYQLGFTEAARNFQQDNFGRGGLGGDPMVVEGQDYSATNGANIFVPDDGQSAHIQMGIFDGPDPDRSSGFDQDVLLHELTHGTSLRLHGGANVLFGNQASGMGEGWGDFYARALLSTPDEDVNGIYPAGGYSTLEIIPGFTDNYYYGIRRFPYAVMSNVGPNGRPHNPLTFADIDPSQADLTDGAYPRGPRGSTNPFEIHAIGEVWCMALLEVRARLIARLGWATGNQLALQLVTDGMKLDPPSPNFLQARNAIRAANLASADASGATEVDIWRGFAARGMGFSATSGPSNSSAVVEAFDVPNISIGTIAVLGDDCGAVDPGDTAVLSIPFTNPYQLNVISDAIVTVGGTSMSLGPLQPGQTVTHTFPVTVPSTTTCGTRYDVPISVVNSLGTVTRQFSLQIGVPTSASLAGTFASGSVAAPILDGQTTEVPIAVTESGPIGPVRIAFRLNHTSAGDLVISLVAPDGTEVTLANQRGGSGDNFGTGANDCSGVPTFFDDFTPVTIASGTAPFTGSFRAESPLGGLAAHEMNGIWKLRVRDVAAGNTGTIGCATLDVVRQYNFCCGVEGTPVIQAAAPVTVIGECPASANGAPDPGEIVTMNFPMQNRGSGATTNLVATLLSGGGVTPLSGPQSYGVLSPIGPAVARPFELMIDGSVACGSNAVATFALTDDGADLGTVSFNVRTGALVTNTYTFSNSAPITIPATGTGATTGAPAAPYPSSIAVSGVVGTMTGMSMTLRNFSHTRPGDVDLLLVGPGGQKFIVMSDMGAFGVTNRTLTLDSAAFSSLPPSLVSGTYRPGNSGAGDPFPFPAPPPPYESAGSAGQATFPSVFNNTNLNGTWSLYAVDDLLSSIGSISGGWSLNFTTTNPVCATVSAPASIAVTTGTQTLWPPDHRMHEVSVAYTSPDCADCTITVTSNEPQESLGDGDTGPDHEVIDAHRVRLRAERSAAGNGRVYTITVTCKNGTGTSVQSTAVRVEHDNSGL